MMSVITPRKLSPLAGQSGTAMGAGMRNSVTRRTFLACAVLAPLVAGGCEESPVKKAARKAEKKAFKACFVAVWSQVQDPSEADFGSYKVEKRGTGYRFFGRVKLMNVFGAMIPHRYVCDYKGGRAEVVAVRPG